MGRTATPELERFMAKVAVRPDAHWEWITAYSRERPQFRRDREHGFRVVPATHVALELVRGIVVPDGMTADHLCEAKWCVAPDHLDVCTATENVRRWWDNGRREVDMWRAATNREPPPCMTRRAG